MPRWCRNPYRFLGAGAQSEDPLDPALAARMGERLRQRPDNVFETGRGVVDGLLELAHLPGVLDQPQFAQHGGEFGVV